MLRYSENTAPPNALFLRYMDHSSFEILSVPYYIRTANACERISFFGCAALFAILNLMIIPIF